MRNSRLIGGKPKIGIRPIIDGRRGGIRESLEDMTMAMAHKVAELYSSVLRHSDGTSVECVIADTTIGGVAEAAMAAEKFRNSGVGVVLSVTPCWCYGFETIDMDGEMPKAIWGFNGTERPGAVYLASALASHTQKGLPTFGIYGRDVQEVTNMEIPEDVQEKLLRFARAGIAVATMKGKSYLSIGSVSMGIAGSIPNPDFFQEYLGMRNEYVDASEIERRVQLGIYDHEEFARAMAWTEKYCKSNEGTDFNPEHLVYSREEKDARWEYVVKMTLIFRDMMIGNPKLAEMGFKEESMGHNAIAAGFQGQRQWTDYKPDGDFSEAILNTSFDWNGIREAFTFATENDTLNCTSMLFNHLLTNTAQIFADVRTYWSPNAIERVTGKKLEGKAANGFIHLINSGSCTLDGTGCQTRDNKPVMKPFWEITEEEVEACLSVTKWHLRYRKTTEELEQSVILTEVKNAYKDVAGLYETDSLINNRPAFEKEVEALLKERLSTRGFTFTNIQSSVKPNDVLQAAIDEKNTAVQNALKVENEKKAAIAEAEKVVAAAKGKADANRILQQSITPELIQLKAVEKWDGKLPLSTGGNTLPFLKLQ